MTFARHLTLLLLAAAPLIAHAQEPAPPAAAKAPSTPASAIAQLQPTPFNRTIVVLDPAHGAGDTGSRINDQLVEKDITLALALRIRALLSSHGFTIAMTRESDDTPTTPGPPLSFDDRAGFANRSHPLACLLLHATASGTGVHLYTSELDPTPGEPIPTPWLTAQAAWVTQSQQLAKQMGASLNRAKIPIVISRASVRPVDSLACPALVVELAPNGTDPATLGDATYQQRVAEALADALALWQKQAQPPARLAPPAATPAPSGVNP